MEDFEYRKEFPQKVVEAVDYSPDEKDEMTDLLQRYERFLKEEPRVVLPFAPALFEKTIADCERIAEEFYGRIKAKIDYSFYTATIEIWCCYAEFMTGEFMSVLHQLSHTALSVRFTPLSTGELHIHIMMPYFVSVKDLKDGD